MALRIEHEVLKRIPASKRLAIRQAYMGLRGLVEAEARLVARALDGGVAIDVGANHGLYTKALAGVCDAVEAFEPQPFCRETIAAAGFENVTCHSEGVSNTTGELALHIPTKRGVRQTSCASFGDVDGPHDTIMVPVSRLDDHDFRDVAFIKIDTEGHELAVLEGARATLERERPLMLIEIMQCHLHDTTVAEELARIAEMGFLPAYVERDRVLPLVKPHPENLPGNFLFVPEERAGLITHLDTVARSVLSSPLVSFAARRAV